MDRVKEHYDKLVDEGVDFVHDSDVLKEYMNKWDGDIFVEQLGVLSDKNVLEIGVGTGRVAIKIIDCCKSFTGIDVSPKTIDKATNNLENIHNTKLICHDFVTYCFDQKYDIIYSTLTFMHIKDKHNAITKVASLLNSGGRFVLSIDKNRSQTIDYGLRIIDIYPDDEVIIEECIKNAGLTLENKTQTEFAIIFTCVNDRL